MYRNCSLKSNCDYRQKTIVKLVIFIVHFNKQYNSSYIRINMQFLGTIININKKQIIKQQILDKVVLVETFLVGHQQILDLERRHLADHIDIITVSSCQNNKLQLMLIKNLEKLKPLQNLTVCR